MDEGGQRVQTSSYKINKFWVCNIPYDPAIPLLGIHTEETRRERDTCTPMFIPALFIIDRTWKQMNGEESYGTYTQWSITQPLKRKHLNVLSNEVDETGAYYTE